MRLIDADKLKAEFIGNRYGTQAIEYVIDQQPTVDADSLSAKHEDIGYEKGYRDGYAEALEVTDDAEPVRHGQWITVSDGYGNGVATASICECSLCKDTIWVYKDGRREWHYCPNCGAKMDGERREGND